MLLYLFHAHISRKVQIFNKRLKELMEPQLKNVMVQNLIKDFYAYHFVHVEGR